MLHPGLGLTEVVAAYALLHHATDFPLADLSFEKPALIRKISHWQMLLSEFDIVLVV